MKWGWRVWTGLIWLRQAEMNMVMNCRFHKVQIISRLAEGLLACLKNITAWR
jgi:hypothetical protein